MKNTTDWIKFLHCKMVSDKYCCWIQICCVCSFFHNTTKTTGAGEIFHWWAANGSNSFDIRVRPETDGWSAMVIGCVEHKSFNVK